MAADSIPADVRDFIHRHVDSIAQLEALLLLRREKKVRWTGEAVAERLYVSPEVASNLLARLYADGFLSNADGAFQYQCAEVSLNPMVDRVADIYATQLIPMTNLIHSKASRIREFADAFKVRRDT
jgi:hypothetical protein